jgi:hypothetical protein
MVLRLVILGIMQGNYVFHFTCSESIFLQIDLQCPGMLASKNCLLKEGPMMRSFLWHAPLIFVFLKWMTTHSAVMSVYDIVT